MNLKNASAPGADIRDQDFTYDLNGNILKSGNREFGWTSFDKPEAHGQRRYWRHVPV